MKLSSERVAYELKGADFNIKLLGKVRFWQLKNKRALQYWEGYRDALIRLRWLFQIEEMRDGESRMKTSEAIEKLTKKRDNALHFQKLYNKGDLGWTANESYAIAYSTAINLLEQIDEPAEKVEEV